MVEVLVEYDYTAQADDELTIKVGDVISNVSKEDGGWWEGEINGRRGMFPDNFVKEVKKEKQPKPREEAASRKTNQGGGHVAELANKLGPIKMGPPQGGTGLIKRGDRDSIAKKRLMRAKVAYSYAPENDDELRLEVGEIVEIIKQEEEGWWEGSLAGKTGVFPSNFVELLEESENDQAEFHAIAGKKIKGVGLGNIFSEGPIKLRSTGNNAVRKPDAAKENNEVHKEKPRERSREEHKDTKDTSERPSGPGKRGAPPPVPSEPPVVAHRERKATERAKVLYSYLPENEDELALTEGDIITILEKELEDSGWWKGELSGKIGVFPDNFVELLPQEEVRQIAHKPRKPPPPAVPPSGPPKNKLDKAPAPEPPKEKDRPLPERPAAPVEPVRPHRPPKEEHKEDKPSRPDKPAPMAPVKKPAVPPPVGRKPSKSADPKLIAQTDEHKAKEMHNKDTKDHKTHEKEKSDHDHHKDKETEHKRIPPLRSIPVPGQRTSTVDSGPKTPLSPKHSPPEEKPDASKPATVNDAASAALVQQLKDDIHQLKENTVPKEKYTQLQNDLLEMKETMAQFKSLQQKRFLELMGEIDEEKKVRLNMQVEIDRLKKLVTS